MQRNLQKFPTSSNNELSAKLKSRRHAVEAAADVYQNQPSVSEADVTCEVPKQKTPSARGWSRPAVPFAVNQQGLYRTSRLVKDQDLAHASTAQKRNFWSAMEQKHQHPVAPPKTAVGVKRPGSGSSSRTASHDSQQSAVVADASATKELLKPVTQEAQEVPSPAKRARLSALSADGVSPVSGEAGVSPVSGEAGVSPVSGEAGVSPAAVSPITNETPLVGGEVLGSAGTGDVPLELSATPETDETAAAETEESDGTGASNHSDSCGDAGERDLHASPCRSMGRGKADVSQIFLNSPPLSHDGGARETDENTTSSNADSQFPAEFKEWRLGVGISPASASYVELEDKGVIVMEDGGS